MYFYSLSLGECLHMAFPLTGGTVTSLSEILSYRDSVNWIIGASKTGKTTFLAKFIQTLPKEQNVYLLDTSGKNIDNELGRIESVKVLPNNSQLNEECLEKLEANSFVIVDDFQLLTKAAEWQRVTNYCAHHFHLSIFLVVHSHQHTDGLHHALKNAGNLYLTYSNNSKYFLKSIAHGKYLNFFNRHWKEGIQNKHICFINTYYSVIVSFVDKLLFKIVSKPVELEEMTDYVEKNLLGDIEENRWLISNATGNNSQDEISNSDLLQNNLEAHFQKELRASYSKGQFPKMFKITRCLLKKGVLGIDEKVLGKVNLMDFLAFTQRFAYKLTESESESADSSPQFEGFGFCGKISVAKNKGSKKSHRENKKWRKVCHKLIEHGVTIPITLLKNPVAKKYFR